MIADESLVTLNGLKKYDQTKGTAVIEANELPASPLNKVYNVGDDVYSKDVRLSTYQQMIDEVDKVKVDGNTQDANRNIISKAVIEQANVSPAPLDKVYNVGGSPIELTASGTCTQETSPGGTETVEISNLQPGDSSIFPSVGNYSISFTEDTSWESQEITYRDLTFTAVKMYEANNIPEMIFADSVTINGTVHSNVSNGEVFTGTSWVIIWNDIDNFGRLYLTDANVKLPVVSVNIVSGLNCWEGTLNSIPTGTTEVTFNNDYTLKLNSHDETLIQLPYGEHALYSSTDLNNGNYGFTVFGYNLPTPTATIETEGSGLYMGDCFFNHLPAGSSFKLKSSIDNVWHTVSYPLPENGTFIYGTSLSEESCLVIQTNDNQLKVVTIDETQNQAFTIDYEEETSVRVFSKSIELITKDSADDLFISQSEKGVASGVATLGADGKVPRSQLTVEAMEYKGKVYVNTPEPADKSVGDVYFVGETGTIWGKSVNEGDQLVWSGSDWDVWSAGRVLSVDGKTNEVVINQSLTSTQYNNLTTIDPLVNYFITDKKQIYRNGYCYSIKVVALSQSDYNNLTPYQKQDTMTLYIVDNNKLYYLDNPVGMLGNELRYTTSIPTEDGFFVYVGNVPNAAGLYSGCIYYKSGSTYTLYTPKYTEDILEKSAFTYLQTSAGATQHAVNEAIDHAIYVDELAIGNNATGISNLRNQLDNLVTDDIREAFPLPNIGTVANATQHAVNAAVDGNALLSKKDPQQGEVTFNGDLNVLIDQGIYSIVATGHTPQGLNPLYGTALVYKGKYNYIHQEVSSATASRKWIRFRNEYNNWGNWIEVTEPKTVSLYLTTSDLRLIAGSTYSVNNFITSLWNLLTSIYSQAEYFNVSGQMKWEDVSSFNITDGNRTIKSSGAKFDFFVRRNPWACNGGTFIEANSNAYIVRCKYLDTVFDTQENISQIALA